MPDYTRKLAKQAASVLEPGEVLLAGVRGMTKGYTAGLSAGVAGAVAGGALGVVVGQKLTDKTVQDGVAQAEAAGFPTSPMMSLGLTARRLLVFERSQWTGKAGKFLAEVPVGRIASLVGGSTKLAHLLTITFLDGSSVDVEVVRLDGTDGIVGAFRQLRGDA